MTERSKFTSRPLLAATITPELTPRLKFPLLVSPKLDGVRMRIDPTLGGVSRTYKMIPNDHIQTCIEYASGFGSKLDYLDGELIVGSPYAPDVFNVTQSAVMTQAGNPSFSYYVFDNCKHPELPFAKRYDLTQAIVADIKSTTSFPIELVEHTIVNSWGEVEQFEEDCLSAGYEGIMLRSPEAPYKFGRSTFKEHTLLKLKRFEDAEAKIVGFEALERNTNEQTQNVFGLSKRSSHKAGKVADELLGKFTVEHPEFGQFYVGSGFDVATRIEIWQNQDKYLGRTISFKFQRVGTKDKPRAPIFKGFRHD